MGNTILYTPMKKRENRKHLVCLAQELWKFSTESKEVVNPEILSLSPYVTISYFLDHSCPCLCVWTWTACGGVPQSACVLSSVVFSYSWLHGLACQAPLPWDSPGKNNGVFLYCRLPCPPPEAISYPEIEFASLRSPTLAGGFFTTRVPLPQWY